MRVSAPFCNNSSSDDDGGGDGGGDSNMSGNLSFRAQRFKQRCRLSDQVCGVVAVALLVCSVIATRRLRVSIVVCQAQVVSWLTHRSLHLHNCFSCAFADAVRNKCTATQEARRQRALDRQQQARRDLTALAREIAAQDGAAV